MNGRLGNAIHVDQKRVPVAKMIEPRPQGGGVQRFATKHHISQIKLRAAFVIESRNPRQLPERGRRLVQHGHLFASQEIKEVFRRAARAIRHDNKPAAIDQRAEHLPDREIERDGVEHRPDVMPVKMKPEFRRLKQTHRRCDA